MMQESARRFILVMFILTILALLDLFVLRNGKIFGFFIGAVFLMFLFRESPAKLFNQAFPTTPQQRHDTEVRFGTTNTFRGKVAEFRAEEQRKADASAYWQRKLREKQNQ